MGSIGLRLRQISEHLPNPSPRVFLASKAKSTFWQSTEPSSSTSGTTQQESCNTAAAANLPQIYRHAIAEMNSKVSHGHPIGKQ